MSKLNETDNILELYEYATGKSEIPQAYHKWACISLVAATLADSVFYRKLAWERMSPNMYIMLCGPSACGKGGAIGFSAQFYHDNINLHYGATTKQALFDKMARKPEEEEEGLMFIQRSPAKVYIVQDEMAEAVGTGNRADEYIKAMVGWYNPKETKTEESTRMHGAKVIEDRMCLNWLAGTTPEWLQDVVDLKTMMSGFFGRVVPVPGDYDFENRVYEPWSPPDYDEVVEYLKARFFELSFLEGEFTMLPAAKELDREWYETRPEPSKELTPFWRREHDLILKLAMILSACDSLDLQIHPHHITHAQNLIKEIRGYLPKITELSAKGGMSTNIDKIREFIHKHASGVKRSLVTKRASHLGMRAGELNDILEFLKAQEEIEEFKHLNGTKYREKKKQAIDWSSLKEDE